MDWVEITKYLGTSTAVLAVAGFVMKSIASHFLNRDLEQLKDEIKSDSDHALQEFKGSQDKALQAMKEMQEARMEELRQEHARVLQETAWILKSRDNAYGEIWELSKCVNLFGPTVPVDCCAVSRSLTDWYFASGQLLTHSCRQIYFAIQEVLNFYDVRSIVPTRPAPEILYCGNKRPVDVLIGLEEERLGIPPKGNLGAFSQAELSSYVDGFKARSSSRGDKNHEDAWLLLHFLMSSFRSRLVDELGWRKSLQSTAAPPSSQAASQPPVGNGAYVISSSGAQHTR